MKKLLILGLILIVAGLVAVPAFAQLLSQGETGVSDPVAGGGSVPEDVTSAEPASTENDVLPTDAANSPSAPAGGSGADVIPVELSSELCADVTDPLVVGTFEQVLPEVVQGCLERASIPTGTAPVDTAPVDTAPVDTVPVDTAPVDTVPVDTVPSV